jgi:hypothetical protein
VLVLGSVVELWCCLDAENALLIIMQRHGNVNGGKVRLSNCSIKNRNHTASTLYSTVVVIRQFWCDKYSNWSSLKWHVTKYSHVICNDQTEIGL